MPYKDPEKRKECKRNSKRKNQYKYRVDFMTEEQRIRNNQRMKFRGLPHKRAYTDNGGVWMCYYCGTTMEDGVELHIHHKDQDPTNNSFENLVCLCEQCHLGVLHRRWNNVVIPELIRRGIVDWEGNIREESVDNG